MIPRPLLLALLLAISGTGISHAAERLVGFQSPSKNIACQLSTIGTDHSLRCDIDKMSKRPRRPADCELDWGNAFEMGPKNKGTLICYGDSMFEDRLPVLGYGAVWRRGGFTCRSELAGVTCFNAARHGFSLSREKQQMF